jgi:membrane associated rhomboid family serine protease
VVAVVWPALAITVIISYILYHDCLTTLRSPFRYSYFNASLVLIGINVLVYALGTMFRELPLYLGMMPIAMVRLGWIWQPFTYMFVHGSLQHLLFNMLGLFFFGSYVERELGSKEFLLYYLLTGTLAGIFSFGAYAVTGAWGVRLVGASGAVYAVLLAFAVINPRARIYIWGLCRFLRLCLLVRIRSWNCGPRFSVMEGT